MKTGSRSAIATAALCLLVCAAAQASESVSLVSLDAAKTSAGAQIDIRTSDPANLRVDRFALGDYIFVWAPGFEGPPGSEDIPLEFNATGLSGLVTGVSLARDGRRNGIKVVLGPEARRQGAFLMQDGAVASLIIPFALDTGIADNAASQPAPFIAWPQEPSAVDLPSAVEGVSPALDPPTELDGSFYIPRGAPPQTGISDSTEAAAPSPQVAAAELAEPVQDEPASLPDSGEELAQPGIAPAKPTSLANVFNTAASVLAGQPEVNYQIVQQESIKAAPTIPPRGEDADKAAARLEAEKAEQEGAKPQAASEPQASPASTYEYSGVPPGSKAKNPLGTAGGGTAYNPYLPEAAISNAEQPVGATGKESLRGVMIELFEIVNTPLDQALTLLIAPTEFNIIVDASVSSNLVSLSFKESKTDLRSALDLLTRTYGLDYVVEANTIVVAPKDKVSKELIQRENRLFLLSFSDPKRVKAILDKMAIVPADQIVVYGGEDFSEGASGGGGGAAGGGGGALGALLGGGGGGGGDSGGAEGGIKGFTVGQAAREIKSNLSSSPPNAIMVSGTREQLEQVEAVIKTVDRRPKVIELEVRVCEATETALADLGIMAQDPLNTGRSGGISETWTEARDNERFEAFSLGSMLRSGLSLTARLNTLQEDGKLETLAQPVLSTVEDKQANYFAGERIPYVKSISVTNNTVTQTVEFLDVGITLAFKPRLDADGQLTIQVEPTISSLIEFVDLAGDVTAPRTLSRNVQAMVRVEDCEPFVLAGLISTREKETMSKIPLLADLPLVGRMFRNKNKDNQRTEVIVIVTPHVR